MNKNALVIGGSSGIGKATVKKLASEGFNLSIIHRDRRHAATQFKAEIDELSDKFPTVKIGSYNIDATNASIVSNTLQSMEIGHFDVVLHALSRGNLGELAPGNTSSLRNTDLQLTIDAMGINILLWAQELKSKNMLIPGSAFLTLSSEGKSKYLPGYGAVALAKATLESLTDYLAVEYAKFQVRFNCIIAGVIDTPSVRLMARSEEILSRAQDRNPYNRLTTPEDVANAVYLLSRDEAKWINGAKIHVDGGEHLI